MKHPLFAKLGKEYPHTLEQRFDRILTRIEQLWDTPEALEAYFDALLIDRRGGRQGFPPEVLKDILRLRELSTNKGFGVAEAPQTALEQLHALGYAHDEADFFRALSAGDKELIDLYVRSNFDTELRDADGATPMLYALKQGFTIAARILLNSGTDVDARDRLGLTPLLVACGKPTYGYRAIAEDLIEKGAYIHARDPLGNTPFLLAVSGGQYEIAERLASRGADVDATNYRGESPTLLAQTLEPESLRERMCRLITAHQREQ